MQTEVWKLHQDEEYSSNTWKVESTSQQNRPSEHLANVTYENMYILRMTDFSKRARDSLKCNGQIKNTLTSTNPY